MKSFAVLGLGRFGRQLALSLASQGADVLAIDRDCKNVDAVSDSVTRAVTANLRDEDVLEELGVAECDCVILSVGSDLALAVITVMNLKKQGCRHLICKAYDEMFRDVVLRLGADEAIIPESEAADKLSARLTSSHLKDFLRLSDDTAIEECVPPRSWNGKSMQELKIRNRYKVTVIAIRRGKETLLAIDAETKILAGDTLVLIGSLEDLKRVSSLD